ncbi:uncharacterized protein N7459_000656 [Penicillium hispanicum]|uniref:uncharacterized protein n=1 Tax=Penicillium hispanicum TaxID=1080232 RepID=UPI0025425620|nr:uncharacterized protein N7459_000656 [Penicillium hispanicum]KAJ5594448.1 hypothetical protein N7459_000656 [Penicillium hispanicum]
MGSLGSFLVVYVLGGLTLIPLLLLLVILYAYLTLPGAPALQQTHERAPDLVHRPTDDEYSLKSGTDQLAEKFYRMHDSDVAAGYFAVCREYVPGGVNGKPPERTTPAGEVVAAESPSVYQAMYRSLFERKQVPSIEPAKSNGKNIKRARNVFYIVLRHGHLMLYDDANQVEVRYVISLAHHNVSLHGGEGDIPEGELWVKRNAICLSRRLESLGELGGPTPPFYLFSENLSEKEDFYFAMLQNQQKLWDLADRPPTHQEFNVKHLVALVQRLHSSEEQLQTRWINAILGRLFLALYKTRELHDFVRSKIAKKISRVNKPNFISKVGLQNLDMGEGAPFITNPRLKDLTADGNCCVEADLQYTGNFRIEISATVRIDLGPRFKTREVDIVLAVVLKKLEGHLLVRCKPPPSNRLWISFETMPRMSMEIQPIVSSKQITYSLILRTIESKIREVVAESIVLPFWDDIPFLDTMGQSFRGGIWQRGMPDAGVQVEIPDGFGNVPLSPKTARGRSVDALKTKDDRTMSMPILSESLSPVKSRNTLNSSNLDLQKNHSTAASTGIERPDNTTLPRAIRSQTFSHAADPVLTADNAKFNKVASENKDEENSSATNAMIEISSRSPPASPNRTPSSSPPTGGLWMSENAVRSRESSIAESLDGINANIDNVNQSPSSAHLEGNSFSRPRSSRGSSTTSIATDSRRRRSTVETLTKSFTSSSSTDKSSGNITIGSATAAAKKWSWSVFGKGDVTAEQEANRSSSGAPDQPIGRGHPHPPPGAPLPRPDRYALKRNAGTLPKRKPVATSSLSEGYGIGDAERPVPLPSLPRRKPIPPAVRTDSGTDELLVIEAPQDSAPNSPAIGVSDLEECHRDPISLDKNTSSQAFSFAAHEKRDGEGGPDTRCLTSIEPVQAPSPKANSGSEAVSPYPEQVQVSSA